MWGNPSLWFSFAFLQKLVILSIFSCVCWLPVGLLWINVCLGLLLIFDWVVWFLFLCWAAWAACIFCSLILCQLLHLQIFSPILRVVLSSYLWLDSLLITQSLLTQGPTHSLSVFLISWRASGSGVGQESPGVCLLLWKIPLLNTHRYSMW